MDKQITDLPVLKKELSRLHGHVVAEKIISGVAREISAVNQENLRIAQALTTELSLRLSENLGEASENLVDETRKLVAQMQKVSERLFSTMLDVEEALDKFTSSVGRIERIGPFLMKRAQKVAKNLEHKEKEYLFLILATGVMSGFVSASVTLVGLELLLR